MDLIIVVLIDVSRRNEPKILIHQGIYYVYIFFSILIFSYNFFQIYMHVHILHVELSCIYIGNAMQKNIFQYLPVHIRFNIGQ